MEYVAYDGNQWRVERLHKATKIASQILGLSTDQLESLIWSIKDAKGALLVKWKHKHTAAQMQAFSTAWEMCKENADKVFFLMEYEDFMLSSDGGAE